MSLGKDLEEVHHGNVVVKVHLCATQRRHIDRAEVRRHAFLYQQAHLPLSLPVELKHSPDSALIFP
jgi:hypothetical protein